MLKGYTKKHILYKERVFSYGLHEIGTMKNYLNRMGMGAVVNRFLDHDETGAQIWHWDLIKRHSPNDEAMATMPWAWRKTLLLFSQRTQNISLMITWGHTLKDIYDKHGKGIDFDTFVHLIKTQLFMKGSSVINDLLENLLFKTDLKIQKIRAVK